MVPHCIPFEPFEKSMFTKVDQWILEAFSQWPFGHDVRLLRSSNDHFPMNVSNVGMQLQTGR